MSPGQEIESEESIAMMACGQAGITKLKATVRHRLYTAFPWIPNPILVWESWPPVLHSAHPEWLSLAALGFYLFMIHSNLCTGQSLYKPSSSSSGKTFKISYILVGGDRQEIRVISSKQKQERAQSNRGGEGEASLERRCLRTSQACDNRE